MGHSHVGLMVTVTGCIVASSMVVQTLSSSSLYATASSNKLPLSRLSSSLGKQLLGSLWAAFRMCAAVWPTTTLVCLASLHWARAKTHLSNAILQLGFPVLDGLPMRTHTAHRYSNSLNGLPRSQPRASEVEPAPLGQISAARLR